MLGPGSWVSFTWWVMCVNPHRDGSFGLCITTAYISLQGKIQMPRYSPVIFCFQVLWSVLTQVAGRRQCLPQMLLQTRCKQKETSRSISFLVSYHQFAYQTTCWVEALKFWYRLSWNLSGRTTNSHSLIFPWYLRHTYNPNQGTKI